MDPSPVPPWINAAARLISLRGRSDGMSAREKPRAVGGLLKAETKGPDKRPRVDMGNTRRAEPASAFESPQDGHLGPGGAHMGSGLPHGAMGGLMRRGSAGVANESARSPSSAAGNDQSRREAAIPPLRSLANSAALARWLHRLGTTDWPLLNGDRARDATLDKHLGERQPVHVRIALDLPALDIEALG